MSVFEIVFSPTGGTQKVSGLVAGALDKNTVTVDLTDSGLDFSAVSMTEDDVAVISVPAYAGRIPAVVADRLGMVHGNGARAVLVCVYGNRAFEDTLVELEDVAKHAGFRVIAAVAAIAEHSIARQFAAGRPDAQDAAQLAEFAQQIQQKLLAEDASEPSIPGNRPYKQAGGHSMVPHATEDCVSCGACAALCPVRAIDKDDPRQVDGEACISCMRCVSVCPQNARKLDPNKLAAVTQMLSKACVERRECEIFI
ncbi:EFR1 family ferrodoxin [Collinsella aerofaciens]|uniref:EFR1 family ferrodoxin n=1 Tax=Collinsella aerofaciens TaxID=74426 RepID=UPI0018991BB3|nr:EFR1 family ferrodoxin [Collinsella aerofaciens]MDB1846271.1 EFR1 family ferrodoxin [Collinsella aerofaciens]MDB1848150.1 EFR1 family ferrodoxin [Collinsella aerofaciens]MDB1853590.1 EFR1 family ferrodoxin [Collinsella aerofaciens]